MCIPSEGDGFPVKLLREPGPALRSVKRTCGSVFVMRDRRRGSALTAPVSGPASAGAGLSASVICLDRVVRVLLHRVQRRGDQLVEDPRVNRGTVGRDLGRGRAGAQHHDEFRCETLDPSVDVIHGDSAPGQQFLDVPAGQAIPQVPTDRNEITSGGNLKPAKTETGPMMSLHQSPAAAID